MAGLTGLGLPGLLNGEGVTGMAGIAGGNSKPRPTLFQFFYFSSGLQANFVAPSAAFHPFGRGHGLPVDGRHGLHRGPGGGMFSTFELFHPGFVASGANHRRPNLGFGYVAVSFMQVPVTDRAVDAILVMLAQFPVRDNVWRDFPVTVYSVVAKIFSEISFSPLHLKGHNGFFYGHRTSPLVSFAPPP